MTVAIKGKRVGNSYRLIDYVCIPVCNSKFRFVISCSSCTSASQYPHYSFFCRPLLPSANYYCKGKNVSIDSHVYMSDSDQIVNNERMERMANSFVLIKAYQPMLEVRAACRPALDIVYCHHYFPPCDRTGGIVEKMVLCRETCKYLWKTCDRELIVARQLNKKSLELLYPYLWDLSIANCAQFPMRNAGDTPECWYYVGDDDHKNTTRELMTHCVTCY